MAGGRPPMKRSAKHFLAMHDMDRLGFNPIEEVIKAIRELEDLAQMNIESFREGRGVSEKGDSSAQFLSNAITATRDKSQLAMGLAKFKHPTLSAIAMQDVSNEENRKEPLTTEQAARVILNDPFAPQALKEIPIERVIEAMESKIEAPFLPSGKKDE